MWNLVQVFECYVEENICTTSIYKLESLTNIKLRSSPRKLARLHKELRACESIDYSGGEIRGGGFIHGTMYPLISPPPPQLDKQYVPIIIVRQVMGLLGFYFLTNIVELRIKKIITLTCLGYLNKLGTSIMVDYQTSKKKTLLIWANGEYFKYNSIFLGSTFKCQITLFYFQNSFQL
jgi:hypothetical protein